MLNGSIDRKPSLPIDYYTEDYYQKSLTTIKKGYSRGKIIFDTNGKEGEGKIKMVPTEKLSSLRRKILLYQYNASKNMSQTKSIFN